MGTGSFPGVKSGRGVTLTPHPFYLRVQERVELYLYSPYRPHGLYRASVPVQRCTLPYFNLPKRNVNILQWTRTASTTFIILACNFSNSHYFKPKLRHPESWNTDCMLRSASWHECRSYEIDLISHVIVTAFLQKVHSWAIRLTAFSVTVICSQETESPERGARTLNCTKRLTSDLWSTADKMLGMLIIICIWWIGPSVLSQFRLSSETMNLVQYIFDLC